MTGERYYYDANEVAKYVGCSTNMAKKVIRQLNNDLKSKGYITVSGKVNRQYFEAKVGGSAPIEKEIGVCRKRKKIAAEDLPDFDVYYRRYMTREITKAEIVRHYKISRSVIDRLINEYSSKNS